MAFSENIVHLKSNVWSFVQHCNPYRNTGCMWQFRPIQDISCNIWLEQATKIVLDFSLERPWVSLDTSSCTGPHFTKSGKRWAPISQHRGAHLRILHSPHSVSIDVMDSAICCGTFSHQWLLLFKLNEPWTDIVKFIFNLMDKLKLCMFATEQHVLDPHPTHPPPTDHIWDHT